MVAATLLLAGAPSAADPPSPKPNYAAGYDWILRERVRAGYLGATGPRDIAAKMRNVGMNAVLPKFNSLSSPPAEKEIALLKEWSEAVKKAKLHLLPVINLRGGPEKPVNDRREVTSSGHRMEKTPCPLDEQFWKTYVFARMTELAARAEELSLTGVILDPEMYGSDHTIFDRLCYCDDCLREFLQAEGQPLPAVLPSPETRLEWLAQQGLADKFERRFADRVRGFCRETERAVHERHANFLIGVFLLDRNIPFMRAMAEGFGTEQRPVLGFPESTYSIGYTNRVKKMQEASAQKGAHVLWVPGLWLTQFPSENLAEQFYACAKNSAGCWIFTFQSLCGDPNKMPSYAALKEPQDRYWAALQNANAELDRFLAADGQYESPLKVRPFPVPLPAVSFGNSNPASLQVVHDGQPLSVGAEAVSRLRGDNPLYILAKAGEPVEVCVRNLQLGDYIPGTRFAVFDAEGKSVVEGAMELGKSAVAKWTPDRDGVYVVVATSGSNGYSLQVQTKQPFAFRTSEKQPLHVNGRLGKLYFFVPQGVDKVTLLAVAKGQAPGRGGKLKIIAPDGQAAAKLEGELASSEVSVDIPAAMQGRVWALTGDDITNDLQIRLAPNAVSCLGTDPTRLLQATP